MDEAGIEFRAKVEDASRRLGEHFLTCADCGGASVNRAMIAAKLHADKSIVEHIYCAQGVELYRIWLQIMADFRQFKKEFPIN